MKKFILKNSIIIILILFIHYSLALFADGSADSTYNKFITPKQKSLIIGLSTANQGIRPSIINNTLKNTNYDLPIYNFAFMAPLTPFNKMYYETIKNKLDKSTKNGLFLIEVLPNSIINIDSYKVNLSILENKNPNIKYLINFYKKGWGSIISDKLFQSEIYIHSNGWMEVNIPMDNKSIEKRTKRSINLRTKFFYGKYKISKKKIDYLKKTILFLKNHGEVFLVKLPISYKISELENQYFPKFDNLIENIAENNKIIYLNYTNYSGNYIYTDGIHLSKNSSNELTKRITSDILLTINE